MIIDKIDLQEELLISSKDKGTVSVPEDVFLPVEYKIRRWTSQKEFEEGTEPYLVTRDGGSLKDAVFTNLGGLLVWMGIRGDSLTGRLFNNANAKLVVSNAAGTPAATDTTVVNELGRKVMDSSFPLIPGETAGGVTASARQFILRSTFGGTDANGVWSRFWIVNSYGTEDILDDFSSAQGTKNSGQVWELTVTLTIS
jgi:hypothetical protein